MKEYGPQDVAKIPRLAKTIIASQLAAHNMILKDDGQIVTFTGELVARLLRVTVDGQKIDWFVQLLKSITYIELKVDIDL